MVLGFGVFVLMIDVLTFNFAFFFFCEGWREKTLV